MVSADRPLINRRILLAVTGSVAACKTDRIIRELTDRGAEVQVLLTESGAKFFPPQTAGSLTDYPVVMDQFDSTSPGEMKHIDIKNETDGILVAPATANRLLNLESPHASDALGTVLLAYSGPVMYAPAMNPDMWDQDHVQQILDRHRQKIIQPAEGEMACGETGPGRLADPDQIAEELTSRLWPEPLDGVQVLVSGGPTREPWDDIRFLTNRSSGRMGEALAKIAGRLGADVTLVTGAKNRYYGYADYETKRVDTTEEMANAVEESLDQSEVFISAAAVSDYRPAAESGKIPSDQEDAKIELESTIDILSSMSDKFSEKTFVGFSADDATDVERAMEKAEKKNLDAIVFNSIQQDDGAFGSCSNDVTFCVPPDKTIQLGHRTKLSLSLQIWIGLNNEQLFQ